MHRFHSLLPSPFHATSASPFRPSLLRLVPLRPRHCLSAINKKRQQRLGRKISLIFPQSNVA
ncbi:hypothetical protein E2C01_059505 [Portunus trituberculatus]|uniref:Uncharacterized protein n=1 Tax=Portunus trituberculatus TaxID=210409 RepID=A0A5B7GYD4_PORTR|nr:hypothetical protein [Portunus trituberculatus]